MQRLLCELDHAAANFLMTVCSIVRFSTRKLGMVRCLMGGKGAVTLTAEVFQHVPSNTLQN